jgi:3-dehydroquinate synthase
MALPNPSIYYGNDSYPEIEKLLKAQQYSSVFVLVDENTKKHCLPVFAEKLQPGLPLEVIEIKSGEEHKNITTCLGVWEKLTESGADRKSLLINLGGGVLTDLGGFCASVFKRGIDFIHVPTTLLAMTDAAIGGKTGVDLGALKNQIGIFQQPKMILVDIDYLSTLPKRQRDNGLAEMFKHGLVYREDYWAKLKNISDFDIVDFEILIQESIEIKSDIVSKDFEESGLRKTLNFGHTLGHALESYFLSNPQKPDLLHGEAIATGMIMESYISSKMLGFPKDKLEEVNKTILKVFPKIEFQETDYEEIISFLKHDKKNEGGEINFVLLEDIGKSKIDCRVEEKLILEAFDYYSNQT